MSIKARFEAFLLKLAAWMLNRNVERSMVVSRRDNNWLFEAVFELRAIAGRIESGYTETAPGGCPERLSLTSECQTGLLSTKPKT